MKILNCFIAVSLFAAVCSAQDPLSKGEKGFYSNVIGNVVGAAEKMPESSYGFKPTPEVRTFGELVGHVADAQYIFCSAAAGEKPPMMGIEKSKTTKADLVQALKDAVGYCDKVYGGMTDARAAEIIKMEMLGRDMPRQLVLTINTGHADEHYGNMVTYMRIRGIVPPSSEPRK